MRRLMLPIGQSEGPIPKRLHLIWVGSPVPHWVRARWDVWADFLGDDWTIDHWTDENRDRWPLAGRFAEFCRHPVVLADLIRLEVVHRYGGIYMDSDTVPLRSLDPWTGDRPAWVAGGGWEPTETDPRPINNAIFGFPAGHPFLVDVWSHATEKVQTIKNPYYIAGPKVYAQFLENSEIEVPDWTVFPDIPMKYRSRSFKPTPEALTEIMGDEAVAVHLAEKSWFGANNSMSVTPTFIMAVPWVESRADRARELADETRGKIVWDRTHNAFDTWRSVLRAVGDEPGIILEDDVRLTENWRNKIEAVISEHPDDIIQFFSMRSADVTVGSRYETGRTFMMNQCYYLPAGVAKDLLDFSETWVAENPEHPTGYDVTMGKWMQSQGKKYWLHVPSLVQHEPWTSEINSRRPRNRQSITFSEPSEGAVIEPVGTPLPKVHIMTVPNQWPERDELVNSWLQSDYVGGVCIHPDPHRRGILWNHLTVVECMLKDTHEWSITISDDIVGLPGWERHLVEVMEHAPSPFVSLTHFSSYGAKVAARGAPFGSGKNCMWGPALMIREDVLEEYAQLVRDFYEMDPEKYTKWDDGLFAVFNLLNDTSACFTSRALLEHLDFESTLGHVKGRWRHASSTIRDEGPAWDAQPRTRSGGPSVSPIQRQALADLQEFRSKR